LPVELVEFPALTVTHVEVVLNRVVTIFFNKVGGIAAADFKTFWITTGFELMEQAE